MRIKPIKANPKFRPILGTRAEEFTAEEILQLEKVHQALAILQFKIETQLMKRRPEFQMDNQILLDNIDYWKNTITIDGKSYSLQNTCFQTIDRANPSELSVEEDQIVDSMLASFQGSPKMAKHMELLMKKGSMYKVYNHHLLFHGCIPLKPSGDFQPLVLHQAHYAGKELLDFFEYHIRLAAKTKKLGTTFQRI